MESEPAHLPLLGLPVRPHHSVAASGVCPRLREGTAGDRLVRHPQRPCEDKPTHRSARNSSSSSG
eukprot:2280114-Alexandrium_andersonii.AAC.1